uniref:Zinc finger and SCAN domain-containing protein 30 n=2 Tax=Schistocephalus solidus TaxID=70667 RepID=A0A0X3Q7X5_SCHSO
MSTPKLTAALKVSSALQQRITDTLAARLHQEQGSTNLTESKTLAVQGIQSLVRTPILSEDLMTENTFITPNDNHFVSRNVTTSNYGGLPFFSQFNQFAVSQRTATLVTITNPHGASLAGATVVGTLAPGTTLIQSQQQQPQSPPTAASQSHLPDPSSDTSCMAPNVSVVPASSNGAPQQCANTVNMSNANGHLLPTNDGLDLKPDPVACLARAAAAGLNTSEALFATSTSSTDLASLGFVPLPALTPISAAAAVGLPDNSSSTSGGIHVISATTVSSASCSTEATTVSANQAPLPPTSAITTTSSPVTVIGGGGITGIPSRHSSPVMMVAATDAVGGKTGPYGCRECGKEFRILRYLEKHRRIHTGEKPYQCCYCGRQFNDWPNMNRHKRIHTGERPYRCAVCAKTFSQPAVYNEHVKRHTGERPYICSVCSKGFPRSARLAVHMRVHTGERPYPCNSCDRRFSQPHHLAAHLRVHSGDRPFSCSKCDVSFACISNLRRHRKQVHPVTPPNPATSVPSSASVETQQHQSLATVSDNKFAVRPTFSTSLSMPTEGNTTETAANDGTMVTGILFTPSCSSPSSSSSSASVSATAALLTAVSSSAESSGLLTHSTINDSLLASAGSAISSTGVSNSSLMDTSCLISTSEAGSQQERQQQQPQQQQQQQCPVASTDVLVSQRSNNLVGLASPGKTNLSNASPSAAATDQSGNGGHMMENHSTALEAPTGQFIFDSSTHQSVAEQTLGVSGDTTIYLNSIDVSAAAGAGADLTHLPNGPSHPAALIPTSTGAIQFQHFGSMPVGQFSFAPTVSLSAAVDSKSHLFATNGTTALFSDSTASEATGVGNPLACAKTVQICYSTVPSASVQPDHTTAILLPTGQVFSSNSGFVSATPPHTSVALPDSQHRHSTLQQLSTGQLITAHCQPTAAAAMLLPFASSGFFATAGGAMDNAAAVAPTQIPSIITSGIAFSPAWPTAATCTGTFQLSNVSPAAAAVPHSRAGTPNVQPAGASPNPAGTPLPSVSPHALASTPANNPNIEASPAAHG